MKKKRSVVLLAALFAVGLLYINRLPVSAEETVPGTAVQEETVQPMAALSGTCGENVTWTYDSGSKTLTISGTGPMEDYNHDNLSAPSWIGYGIGEEMKTVVVEEGVTYIGDEAFYTDTSLEEVILPESVTGIGNWAFYLCGRLEKITLPSNINTIGLFAFSNCWALKGMEFPSSVASIGYAAFSDCTGLEQVVLPASLTEIKDNTFSGCTNLKRIEIPSAVKSIGVQAFDDCSKLEEIVLSDNVAQISSRAFMGCKNLKKFSVPGGLTGIEAETFSGCGRLAEITFPDSVTVIEYDAFRGCGSLPKVEIPASVTRIKGGAFRECNSLQEIHFMGGAPEISAERKGDNGLLDSEEAFSRVTATVYYPDDPSWNADTMKDYGGKLTWLRRLYIIAEEAGIEVTDKVYVIGSGTDATIKCSGAAEDFVSLAIDGKTVDPSYYKVESGSTVLTVLSAFLDKLSVGDHTATLNYTYGSVDTVLTVIKKTEETIPGTKPADPTKPADNSTGAADRQNGARKSPQTGEAQTGSAWPMTLVILGIGGTAILILKRKKAGNRS